MSVPNPSDPAPAIFAADVPPDAFDGRVAVLDIGSNSVRFVVYESMRRSAASLHNEKTICRIGHNVANTGLLYREGCDLALAAMKRYRILADRLQVRTRLAVATAAARDAINGAEFVREAETSWGAPIRILSGAEEARLAGYGVISMLADADGMAGDLGGGSLDMVRIKGTSVGKTASFPIGPLRLADMSNDDVEKARKAVTAALGSLSSGFWPKAGARFYAVGGIWRALARVDMMRENYCLHVLQNYVIPRERALALCNLLSRQGKKSLESLMVVSRRRAVLLPYGAAVLQGVLTAGAFREVVICAAGVREGILFDCLPDGERAKDPFLEYVDAENARQSRTPAHAAEMFAWTAPLFADETPAELRLRRAALGLCDLGWRRHPDYRAHGTYAEVLNMPFGGASHRDRVFVATVVFHRYSGDTEVPEHLQACGLLSPVEEYLALRIGLAARLAFDLSGASSGELGNYRLKLAGDRLVLEVPKRRATVADETVKRRLKTLSATMGCKSEIAIA